MSTNVRKSVEKMSSETFGRNMKQIYTKLINDLILKDHNNSIVAMTANAFKEDEQKCIEAGKPLHIKKVIATIAQFCKKMDD